MLCKWRFLVNHVRPRRSEAEALLASEMMCICRDIVQRSTGLRPNHGDMLCVMRYSDLVMNLDFAPIAEAVLKKRGVDVDYPEG
jgi:hypothetical protein